MKHPGRYYIELLMLAACLLAVAGCDATFPDQEPILVIEGYLQPEQPIPPIRITESDPLAAHKRLATPPDAAVQFQIGDQSIRLIPTPDLPGYFVPADYPEFIVPSLAEFDVSVQWQGQDFSAHGQVPPSLSINEVSIHIPDTPEQAILVDTLRLDTLAIQAKTIYIYTIEATVSWTAEQASDTDQPDYWIEARLRSTPSLSSKVLNQFLLTDEIQLEKQILKKDGFYIWKGVYAIEAAGPNAPVPPHDLSVVLVRSGYDYAHFASSLQNPGNTEPVSNIQGGVGILAGIALDSLNLAIP